jgi:hypothetical protein
MTRLGHRALMRPRATVFLPHSSKFELQPKNGWRRDGRVSIVPRFIAAVSRLRVSKFKTEISRGPASYQRFGEVA